VEITQLKEFVLVQFENTPSALFQTEAVGKEESDHGLVGV
jgi:hypothetical protein